MGWDGYMTRQCDACKLELKNHYSHSVSWFLCSVILLNSECFSSTLPSLRLGSCLSVRRLIETMLWDTTWMLTRWKKNYNNIKISIVVSLLVPVHLSLSLWLGYGGWSKVVVLLHSQVTSPPLPVEPPNTSKMQWFLTCWGLRWGTGMFTLFATE